MSEKNKINIPTSMCKKMLGQKGCRVSPDAVNEFKKLLVNFALEVSTKATERTTANKRKTIMKEDL